MYSLFLKATQIETIIEKLHGCLKTAATSKSQLEQLQRSIKQYETEVAVVKDKHEKLQSVARLRRENVEHKNELDWLHITKAEETLAGSERKLNGIREQIEKILDMVKNKSKYEKQLKNKIGDMGTEFVNLSDVVNGKDQLASACRTDYEKKKEELSVVETAHRNLVTRKATSDDNLVQLQNDIAERENNPSNVENIRKENEKKIALLEKKKEDLKLHLSTARRDHGQFMETVNDHRDKIDAAKKQYENIRTQVEGCNKQIRQLESSKADALSAYGPSMSQLIKRLEDLHKRGRFQEMPRGPLGRYIEVTDQKYKSAVENILDTSLLSFCVHSDKDRILLSQTLKQFPELVRTSIITGAFTHQVYDVRNGMARISPDTGRVLMDVIKVSDPVVMNCLIDQRHIESIVLVENTEVAIEMTQDVENVPQNLLRVVLLRPFSEYYPAPNYRSYAMTQKPVRYIQTSLKEVLEGMKTQKNVHETKLKSIAVVIKQFEGNANEKNQNVQDKKRQIDELQQKERNYDLELEELKAVEYPPENEIEFLRTELEVLQKRQMLFERKLTESEEKLKEEQAMCEKKDNSLKQSREEARKARDKMTSIQREIESTQQQLIEMDKDVKLKSNQVNDLKVTEVDALNHVTTEQLQVDGLKKKAAGQRVEVKRTAEIIQKSIISIEQRIRSIEACKENIQDVGALLESKIHQVEKLTKTRNVLDQVLKTLEIIRTSRFYYVKKLRQHMSIRCKHKFHVLMGLRDYSAEVEIDHKEKTLSLKVIPRDSAVANAVSGTKSLSGGERSYSTVAFLIALWSCVDHPFYFLDEYDVFSDEHNRHMMTQLLFNEANKKLEKQYGFLTPQDFSNIQASETITIHKLNDPDRMN